jgi:aldehyde dehydrogenase (NAD+)
MSMQFMNLIGGEPVAASTGRTFDDVNPADTRDIVGRFQASSAADAAAAVNAAAGAFDGWRRTAVSKRAKVLQGAADYLEANVARFAEELTREEGKSIVLARDEILRSAQTLRFYAVEGQSFTGETFPNDDPDMLVYTAREPLGVVSVITPWNFPISIPPARSRPRSSPATRWCSSLLPMRRSSAIACAGAARGGPAKGRAQLPHRRRGRRRGGDHGAGGGPRGVLHRLDRRGRAHPPLGAAHHAHADGARREESAHRDGGRRPRQGGRPRGQGRAFAQRPGLHRDEPVAGSRAGAPAFTEKLLAKVKALRIGSGMDPAADIGPLASRRQLDTVLRYVDIGKREATHLHGGERLAGGSFAHGYYVSPAVFTDVKPSMRIAREEIFGPVLAIIEVTGYEDALAKANDTDYGLSAAIATRNPTYMHRFARDIQSGTVKINRTTTGNLVNAPFGGLKRSSTSTFRESGRAGLEFYTQIKTVYQGL